jgi:hypothetical protein
MFLPIAHHALVESLPFVLPALLVVGAILGMRAIERRRDHQA